MPFSFQGIIPAVLTPTDSDGNLLKEILGENIRFLTARGVDGLLILGSTGEFVHLNIEQRKYVLDEAIRFVGNTPVAVNVSHTNARSVIDLARHAKGAGAAAITVLPPWFYPLTDEDLVAFYAAVGAVCDLPLGLYNFPNLTGKKLTPDLVRAVSKETRVSGFKQSGGDFPEHEPLIQVGSEMGFNVMTGWDTHIPEAMSLGAKGCIGGFANFVPEVMFEIHRQISAGRPGQASISAAKMKRIGAALSALEFPLNISVAMEARGLSAGVPKQVISKTSEKRMGVLREGLKELFIELGIPPA